MKYNLKPRKISKQAMVFESCNEKLEFSPDIIDDDVFDFVFLCFDSHDISILETIQNKKSYVDFCFLGNEMSQKTVDDILAFKNKYNSVAIVFSCQIATKCKLQDDILVGNICCGFDKSNSCDYLSVQAINAGLLKYSEFNTIVSCATEKSDRIKKLNLRNDIEKIVWLDNWFQRNIQYIKNRESEAGDDVYICDDITRKSTMSDVLLNHYGTCEDIAASIASILSLLDIPCDVVSANSHAWVIIHMSNASYIWDCTHNITRNPNRLENALQAKEYTYTYTLIGYSTFKNASNPLEDKYYSFKELFPSVSEISYPRDEIDATKKKLEDELGISFIYPNKAIVPSVKHKANES